MTGSTAERERLIERYGGNPLALKIVAPTIADLFGGEIAAFLEQGELIFGSVRYLLQEQFARLSAVEESIMLWLAILREPVTVQQLANVLVNPLPGAQVLEALDALLDEPPCWRNNETAILTRWARALPAPGPMDRFTSRGIGGGKKCRVTRRPRGGAAFRSR